MYWNEAEQLGFYFTGETWAKWDQAEAARVKERAAYIKKNFKDADYKIVTDRKNSWLGTDYKALMGNKVFNKVRKYLNEKPCIEESINTFNDRKLALQREYEAKLRDLEFYHKEDLEVIREMESLRIKR